ncbi:MAG: hypothetical protein COA79_02670 [Planctomycetota bacterium]|nr:MAG: hypothetical protein COA79_02670 [Planctomycetota bacterium]
MQSNRSVSEQTDLIEYILKQIPSSLSVLYKQKLYEKGQFSFKSTLIKGDQALKPFAIKENNLVYEVQLMNKLDVGVYLDAASFRKWLLQDAHKLRVLNLFSYTCTLAVAAMKGGAQDVINVDSSRSALEIGKNNFRLNNLPINPRSFSKIRVHDFLKFAIKKKDLYDLIIIDPSPPPSSCKSTIEKFQYYQKIIIKCLPLLKPKSKLIVSSHQSIPEDDKNLHSLVLKEFPALSVIDQIPYPENYSAKTTKYYIYTYIPGTISEA